MAKLPVVSGKDMVKVLRKMGFEVDRIRGSHIFLIKTEPKFKAVSVPNHKELKKKTLKNILRSADLGTDDLVKLLKGKRIN